MFSMLAIARRSIAALSLPATIFAKNYAANRKPPPVSLVTSSQGASGHKTMARDMIWRNFSSEIGLSGWF